jgi:hypothetical protein
MPPPALAPPPRAAASLASLPPPLPPPRRAHPRCAALRPSRRAAAAPRPPRASRDDSAASWQLPPGASASGLTQFDASDFELVRRLGELSYRSVADTPATLTWTVREADSDDGEGGGAPDALRVGGTSGTGASDTLSRLSALLGDDDDDVAGGGDVAAGRTAGYARGVPPVAAVALYAARHVSGPGCVGRRRAFPSFVVLRFCVFVCVR